MHNKLVPTIIAASLFMSMILTSMQKILGDACPPMETVKRVVSEKFSVAIALQAQVQKEPHQ